MTFGKRNTSGKCPFDEADAQSAVAAGIVLYAGEQQLSFGDRLAALPMAALWTLDSSAR